MINKKLTAILLIEAIFLILALTYITAAEGAEHTTIKKQEAVCRIIGLNVATNKPIISCFYGIRVDATRIDEAGNEVTNLRILAFEEIYEGGTWVDGKYQEDGYFVGKYRKDFFYNDNADVF